MTARAQRPVTVADLFCGAGGSSTGAHQALSRQGRVMDLVAVNHWPTAIATHQLNHPEAAHHCVNLDAARPSELVPGGKLDLLLASPECTHHSRARGGKPVNDQSRMSAWHVVRWCTELRVRCIIIENVSEFMDWGPVNAATGQPVKSRKGEYFAAWTSALQAIGFKVESRVLNCADYGDATTRQRFFLIGRSDGEPIRWPAQTHSRKGTSAVSSPGRYRPWRSAREIINWDLKGRSIFDPERPRAPKTLLRIYAGLVKFKWPEPFLVVLRQHMDARSIDLPFPTITAGGTHLGLAQPIMLPQHFDQPARSTDDPLSAITTISRIGLVEPFVLSQASGGAPRGVSNPLPTITTGGQQGSGTALIAPFYGSGNGETCSSVDQPLPTCTAKARFALVMPLTHTDGSNRSRSVDEPLPTITTANRGELAFIAAQFGERPTQAPRVHSIDMPAPSITATGHVNLIEGGRNFDILFRMFHYDELAAAMSFHTAERRYFFTGNKTEITKQIGNAVPVEMSCALVSAQRLGGPVSIERAA